MPKKDKVLERARERHVPAYDLKGTAALKEAHKKLWEDHKKLQRKSDFLLSVAVLIADRLSEGKPVPSELIDDYQRAKLAHEVAVEGLKLAKTIMQGVVDSDEYGPWND